MSKIRQVPYRGVKVEVDCTGVHCYDTETDHAGDEVILTVSAPVSLRDRRGYSLRLCRSGAVPFLRNCNLHLFLLLKIFMLHRTE